MFKPIQSVVGSAGQPQANLDDVSIKRVFMVLHGFYGNLFLSKFATGSIDEQTREDQGMASARRVWAYALREFDADTVKTALRRCQDGHPEYPPSLPQFVKLCEAARPRAVWTPPAQQPALAMSQELRDQRRAEARAKATEAAHKQKADKASGLDALKQAIADAFSCGGGDEAAMLMRLDRELAQKEMAA